MLDINEGVLAYMDDFKGMPDRLLKYSKILLEGEGASYYLKYKIDYQECL
jgi:hypothetical protein